MNMKTTKQNKIPEFYELKCDYRSCDLMATKYFAKIAFKVQGEGVIARNIKVCERHLTKLVNRLEIPDNSRNIPYVKDKTRIKCSRCGYVWSITKMKQEFIDSDSYMKLPDRCASCNSKSYRLFIGSGRRRNVECLIV